MKRYKNTKYLITEDGKVWSEHTNKFLKFNTINGYNYVSLRHGDSSCVHRLVAEVYLSNPKKYRCVNHINNIRNDNRVENLEWCDHKMNHQHSVKQDRHSKGQRHGMVKLTDEQVISIYNMYISGVKILDIAKIFNTNRHNVYNIYKKRNWKHLTKDL